MINNPAISEKAQTVLQDLGSLIENLSDQEYSESIHHLNGSCIGEHCRHVLELFEELVKGYQTGVVNYELRKRNRQLETDRNFALQKIQSLQSELKRSDKDLILHQSFVEGENEHHIVHTNYLRELVYNIEHTVHHMALIRVALQEIGAITRVNDRFGYADSTVIYRNQTTSARVDQGR